MTISIPQPIRPAGTARQHGASVPWFEKVYVLLVFIYLSDAFVGLFTPLDFGENTPRSPGAVLLELAIYVTAFLFARRRWDGFQQGLREARWAFGLVFLAAASSLWALGPIYVLRQAIWLGMTTGFGVYVGCSFSRAEQVRLLRYALVLIALLSFGFVAFAPGLSIDSSFDVPAWRGIFNEKNILAKAMVLGALTAGYSLWKGTPRSPLVAAQAAAFLFLLFKSRSATSLCVLVLASFACAAYIRFCRSRSKYLALCLGGILALAIGVFLSQDAGSSLLGVLDKDSSLTGRVPIWELVIPIIGSRPVLGVGYASFWGGIGPPSQPVIDAIGWQAPNAHNGYLDLCLELGLSGLSVFLIGFILRFKTALADVRNRLSDGAAWPFVYLTFLILYNFTESTLLIENSLYWALYACCLMRSSPELASASGLESSLASPRQQ